LLKKRVMIGGRWLLLGLSDEEYENLMDRLLKSNVREFERCLSVSRELAEKHNLSKEEAMNLVFALFDKQSCASFSVIMSAIEEKAERGKKH